MEIINDIVYNYNFNKFLSGKEKENRNVSIIYKCKNYL